MTLEEAIKPTAFMKQDVLDTLHPQDCFFAFARSDKYAQVPLFTLEQVKKMLYLSNESYFDAQDFIDQIEYNVK
jgi:hypothetical protein